MEQNEAWLLGSIFIGYLLFFWGIAYLNTINQVLFSKEIACRIKEQVYSCYIKSKAFLYKRKNLESTINHDIPMLEEDYYYAIIHCFIYGLDVLFAFFITFSVHILYGLFCFIIMIIPILFSIRQVDRISETRQQILEEKEKYTHFLSEIRNGKATIRHYQLLEIIFGQHSKFAEKIAALGAKKREQMAASMIVNQNINRLASGIAAFMGFYLVGQGKLTLGWVMAFLQLSSSMTYSLVDTIQTGINIFSCRKLRKKLSEEYLLTENTIAITEKNFNSAVKLGCHCSIKSCFLEERQVLHNIDFSIAPGEKLLITGKNGSGKTTLLKILLGLNENFEGFLKWSDEKEQIVEKEAITHQIAYIPQNPFVFGKTIKENILLNLEEDNEFYQEIKKKACLKAEDEKEINDFEQTISGGEKQKIELARALYSRRNILIFDEPYSAFDQSSLLETERYLLSDPDKTVIVVSHAEREETRKLYTRHLVLENGTVKKQSI